MADNTIDIGFTVANSDLKAGLGGPLSVRFRIERRRNQTFRPPNYATRRGLSHRTKL
jgi:hypothetical protein